MRIGIDISQTAYEKTGVGNYLKNLVEALSRVDQKNEYILFFSSLRLSPPKFNIDNPNFTIKTFKFPPTFLENIWNKFHKFPIEQFIGDVDVFIASDWAFPPSKKAKKATILYDFIVYRFPEETHNLTEMNVKKLTIYPNIVSVQKRANNWVKKQADVIFCISEATKKDAIEILGLDPKKLKVIYPGA